MATKARIVRLGNSRGVRIPKPLLEQSGLEDAVEITATPGKILIQKPAHPREGWDAEFAAMAETRDDALLDGSTSTEWDDTEWTW